MLSIGLMSGTSMDGIDAALLQTDGSPTCLKELGNVSINYDQDFKINLKIAEYAIRICEGDVEAANKYYPAAVKEYLIKELKLLESEILINRYQASLNEVIQHSTYLHGLAVLKLLKKTGYSASQIDVVGYHGQTMLHWPQRKLSIILGDGQALANQIGIKVVNDFRRNDIEAGGQGAPFAPLYHQALAIRDKKIPLVVVNCGGIANLTFISDENEQNLRGFDTGPGNGLVDRLVKQRTSGRETMDKNGQYGLKGKVSLAVLDALYKKSLIKNNHAYLTQLPPKALDIADMKLIPELDQLSLEDACRTLEVFTAETIIQGLVLIEPNYAAWPTLWVLAGGGWNNPVIHQALENKLKQTLGNDVCICVANDMGWNSQAMEAQIFAYFAVRSLQNKPLSVPGTTGVSHPVSGGKVFLPRNKMES